MRATRGSKERKRGRGGRRDEQNHALLALVLPRPLARRYWESGHTRPAGPARKQNGSMSCRGMCLSPVLHAVRCPHSHRQSHQQAGRRAATATRPANSSLAAKKRHRPASACAVLMPLVWQSAHCPSLAFEKTSKAEHRTGQCTGVLD
jgi:hypothetical protein